MEGVLRLFANKSFSVSLHFVIVLMFLFSCSLTVTQISAGVGVIDFEPPQISSTTPHDGETDVSVSQEVIVVFSETMDKHKTPIIEQIGETDPGNWSFTGWDSGFTSATWTHDDWINEDYVTLLIYNYQDASGIMGGPYSWAFTTESEGGGLGDPEDTTPPYVISTSPYNNEEDVDAGQEIIVNFSEVMDVNTIPTIEQSEGTDPAGWVFNGWENEDTSAHWSHNDWINGERIAISISNYKDAAGNIGEEYIWRFNIASTRGDPPPPGGDEIPPYVTTTLPPHGDEMTENVRVTQNVGVFFSEPIDNSSIILRQNQGYDPGGWTGPVWKNNDTNAVWAHNSWEYGDTITLEVLNYKDKAGNEGDPFNWTFKTEAAPIRGGDNYPPDPPYAGTPNETSPLQNTSVTLEVTVEDPDGDIMNVSFYDSEDELIDIVLNIESGDTASILWDDLTCNSSYGWYAIANDGFLNNSESTTWNFTTRPSSNDSSDDENSTDEDATDPNVDIISPSEGEEFSVNAVTIQWTGSDSESGIDYYKICINSGSWINKGTALSHTFTGLSNNIHTVNVKAYDNSGNAAMSSVSFTVDVEREDESESGSDSDDGNIIISENATAVETENGTKYWHYLNVSKAFFDENGLDPSNFFVTDAEGNKHKAELVDDGDGYYTFRALTDKAGNSVFAINGDDIVGKDEAYKNKDSNGSFPKLSWAAISGLIATAIVGLGIFLFKSKAIYFKKDE